MDGLFGFESKKNIKEDTISTVDIVIKDILIKDEKSNILPKNNFKFISLKDQHKRIYQDITILFDNQKLHHSVIFYGVKSIGKRYLIDSIVEHILLKNLHFGLNLVNKKCHPDLLIIENEKAISVDNIRTIFHFMSLKPSFSSVKIVIIDCIDVVNNQGLNAMLKMLEEPQNNTYFFIINHDLSKLTKTIRSRSILQYVLNTDYENFFLDDFIKLINLQDAKILKDLSNSSIFTAKKIMQDGILTIICQLCNFIFQETLNLSDIESLMGKKDNQIDFEILKKSILYLLKFLNPISNERFLLPSNILNNDKINDVIKKSRNKNDAMHINNYFQIYDEILFFLKDKSLFNLDSTHTLHVILILMRNIF